MERLRLLEVGLLYTNIVYIVNNVCMHLVRVPSLPGDSLSEFYYLVLFSWIFSWKILPLVDFTWLPPGNDFTRPEGETRVVNNLHFTQWASNSMGMSPTQTYLFVSFQI